MRWIFLLLSLTLACSPLWAKDAFFHPKHHYNIVIPNKWSTENHSSRVLTLTHGTVPATMSISVKVFPPFTIEKGVEEASITINGFQIERRIAYYDGWENLFEREGTPQEAAEAGASENRVAVYGKTLLATDLSVRKFIIGEYYFLKRNVGYTITIETQKDNWQRIQPDLKRVVDSFWIGSGSRPSYVPQLTQAKGWLMHGGNAQHTSSSESSINLDEPLSLVWEDALYTHSPSNEFETTPFTSWVMANDTLYISVDNQLMAKSLSTGERLWSYPVKAPIAHHLAYGNDMLFFITEDKYNYLYSVIPQTGHIIYKKKLGEDSPSHPIFHQQALYVGQGSSIAKYKGDSGKRLWKSDHNMNPSFPPALIGSSLYLVNHDQQLLQLDSKTGKTIWLKNLDAPLYTAPIMLDDYAMLIFENEDISSDTITENNQIVLIDHSSGTPQFTIQPPAYSQLILEPIVDQNQCFIMSYLANTEETTVYLASSYALPEGKLLWQQRFELPNSVSLVQPLLTQQALVFNGGLHTKDWMVAFDRYTGVIKRPIMNSIEQDPPFIQALQALDEHLVILENTTGNLTLKVKK